MRSLSMDKLDAFLKRFPSLLPIRHAKTKLQEAREDVTCDVATIGLQGTNKSHRGKRKVVPKRAEKNRGYLVIRRVR